jgi:uncharacterized protein
MAQHLTPTEPVSRIVTLDVLRGLAIFGILMVNMAWMNAPVAYAFSSETLWDNPLDNAVSFMIKFLFESKFYVLFSMLFGYGFMLFFKKESDEPRKVINTYTRRLFILILFGVLHVLLLWPGDILIFYGLFGLLLILFRNSGNRKLIKWAIFFLMIPIVITTLLSLLMTLARMNPEIAQSIDESVVKQEASYLAMIKQSLATYSEGSFREIVNTRLSEYLLILPGIVFFYPNVMAMFLIGFYAARKGYLNNIPEHLAMFRKLALWGFVIGIPANLLYTILSSNLTMASMDPVVILTFILIGFGGPLLTLGYLSTIVLLVHKGLLNRCATALSSVGRMALTNYLIHSIVAAFLFHSYGLGLYGKIPNWQGVIITLIIFGIQIPISTIWLKYYRFGPMEWLWRSLTYGKWQSFRI